MTLDELPEILIPRQVSQYLHVGKNQVYALLTSGQIFSIRLGGSDRIPKTALVSLLAHEGSGAATLRRDRGSHGGQDRAPVQAG